MLHKSWLKATHALSSGLAVHLGTRVEAWGVIAGGRARLGAGGHPVPDQGFAKLQAGGFIIPGGPALLYVL